MFKLSEMEQEQANQSLREEAEVCCSVPDDIGNDAKCRMKMKFKNESRLGC